MGDMIPELLDPSVGYDRAAEIYDRWHWAGFWRQHERPVVLNWFLQGLPGRVLDIGSGTGNYRFDLEAEGYKCLSLDTSLRMLEVQRAKARLRGVDDGNLLLGDARALPVRDASFDSVLCARVLSHISEPLRAVSEFARALRTGGRAVVTDVHPAHPYDRVTIRNGSAVSIRVYKHSVACLCDAVRRVSTLRMIEFREFYLSDLAWEPPEGRFSGLRDAPDAPIFYACLIERR